MNKQPFCGLAYRKPGLKGSFEIDKWRVTAREASWNISAKILDTICNNSFVWDFACNYPSHPSFLAWFLPRIPGKTSATYHSIRLAQDSRRSPSDWSHLPCSRFAVAHEQLGGTNGKDRSSQGRRKDIPPNAPGKEPENHWFQKCRCLAKGYVLVPRRVSSIQHISLLSPLCFFQLMIDSCYCISETWAGNAECPEHYEFFEYTWA